MQGKKWIQSSERKLANQLSQRVSNERVSVKRKNKRTVNVEDKQPKRKSRVISKKSQQQTKEFLTAP